MATYTRLGTFILAGELTADPFGKVHRGLTITGSRFDRHKLIRTFSEELLDAGLAAKLEEANKAASTLTGTRGFGTTYQALTTKPAHIACDYVGGRSLAQLIEKAKKEQIPLGVDHALSVLQGVSQSLTVMHSKGLVHGVLSPHSVWVSVEGSTQILAAPVANIIQGLLPKCPGLVKALAPYRPAPGVSALQQDFFALGAILYELITFDPVPDKAHLATAINNATLKAAQENTEALSDELKGLLRRLLLVDAPFESAQAFNTELDRVLYDGDYSPTTFNMAFFMHTLFREENEQDTTAMKADAAADFTPLAAAEGGGRAIEGRDTQKYVRWAFVYGGFLAVILGFLGYSNWQKNKENARLEEQLKAKMAEFEEIKTNLNKLNLEKAQIAQTRSTLEYQSKFGKTEKDRQEATKQLAELNKKAESVDKSIAETTKKAEIVQQNIVAVKPVNPTNETPKPAEPKPTPQPVAPTTPPSTTNPPPAATPATPPPTPTPTATVNPTPAVVNNPQPQAAPTTAGPSIQTDPEILSQKQPTMPVRAAQLAKQLNRRNQSFNVTVKVYVDANGKAQKADLTQESGVNWGFEDAAREAALASTYRPATKDGKPVGGWISIPFRFKT